MQSIKWTNVEYPLYVRMNVYQVADKTINCKAVITIPDSPEIKDDVDVYVPQLDKEFSIGLYYLNKRKVKILEKHEILLFKLEYNL